MTLSPPLPFDWTATYDPQFTDLNTYVRDTFNFLSGPPKLRVAANAVQSGIANLTWTTIQMQSVLEDTYSGWTSGVSNLYTAQVAGWYGITLDVQAVLSAGQMAHVGLLYVISGTAVGPFEYGQSDDGASTWTWDGYDETYLQVGDSVQPQFFQSSGASVSTAISFPSSFQVVWLSE